MTPALLSSRCDSWNTPLSLLTIVRQLGELGLDPCSNDGSIVGAITEWRYLRDGDSLLRSWSGLGLVFVNPPYGRALGGWAEKIDAEARAGVEIVTLVPARPGSRWWAALSRGGMTCYLSGRLTFVGALSPAPFPSAVFYHGERRRLFRRVFELVGSVHDVVDSKKTPLTVKCIVCGCEVNSRRETRKTCSGRCRMRQYLSRKWTVLSTP